MAIWVWMWAITGKRDKGYLAHAGKLVLMGWRVDGGLDDDNGVDDFDGMRAEYAR